MHSPQVDALHRTTIGDQKPYMADKNGYPLVGVCGLVGFQSLVKTKLQNIPKWKENPERVLQVMATASEEWALIEIELRVCAKEGGALKSGGSSNKKRTRNKGRKRDEDR